MATIDPAIAQLTTAVQELRNALLGGLGPGAANAANRSRNARYQRGTGVGEGGTSQEEAELRKRTHLMKDEYRARMGAKKAIEDSNASLQAMSSTLNRDVQRAFVLTRNNFTDAADQISKFGDGLTIHARNVSKQMEELDQSLFSVLAKNDDLIETQQRISDVGEAAVSLVDVFSDAAASDALPDVFAQLTRAGVDAQSVFGQQESYISDTLPALYALRQHGFDVAGQMAAEAELRAELATNLTDQAAATGDALTALQVRAAKLNASINELATGGVTNLEALFKRAGKVANDTNEAHRKGSETTLKTAKVMEFFKSKLQSAAQGLGQLMPVLSGASFTGGLLRIYDEMKVSMKYGSQQADQWGNIIAGRMNLTKEELAQLQQQSRQVQLSSMSQEAYTNTLKRSADRFAGYTGGLDEAARAINEMRIAVARVGDTSGNVASQADDSFQKLFVGIKGTNHGLKAMGWGVEEFTSMMHDLATNEDIQYNLRLIPAQQRKVYLDSIAMQVEYNQALGMSKEQALEAAKALGKLGAEKPLDRLKKAYRLKSLAGMFGVGGGDEYVQMAMRGFRGEGDQDKAKNWLKTVANASSQYMGQGFEQEVFGSIAIDKFGLTELLNQFNTTTGASMKINNELAEAQYILQANIAGSTGVTVTLLQEIAGILGKTGAGMVGAGAIMSVVGAIMPLVMMRMAAPAIGRAVAAALGGNFAPKAAGAGMLAMGAGTLAGGVGGQLAYATQEGPMTTSGSVGAGVGSMLGSVAVPAASRIAGSVIGPMIGRVAGGVLGSLGGPIGTIAGGILGGYVGGWIGDKIGGMIESSDDKVQQQTQTIQQQGDQQQKQLNTQQEQNEHAKVIADETSKVASATMSTEKKFDALLELNKQALDVQKSMQELLAMTEEDKRGTSLSERLNSIRANALSTRYAQTP